MTLGFAPSSFSAGLAIFVAALLPVVLAALAWVWGLQLCAPRRSTAAEVLRSAFLAAPLAVLSALVGAALLGDLGLLQEGLLLVPRSWALAGTGYAASYVVVLAARLRTPAEGRDALGLG